MGTPQTWVGVAHIACSAMALGIHIHTFYPYVNGLEDTTATLLNTIYNCKAYGNEVSIKMINIRQQLLADSISYGYASMMNYPIHGFWKSVSKC